MATGDTQDIYSRITQLLPSKWFGDMTVTDPTVPVIPNAPIIGGLVWSLASVLSQFYQTQYTYAALQIRIKTATDMWLDVIAWDWFRATLQRRQGQSDTSFRALILASVLRIRGNRQSVIQVLEDVTGRTPQVVEPNRPIDTGGYGAAGYGYSAAGAYGSRLLSANVSFAIAYRPLAGTNQYGTQDSDIYSAVNSVRPAGSTVFVQLNN